MPDEEKPQAVKNDPEEGTEGCNPFPRTFTSRGQQAFPGPLGTENATSFPDTISTSISLFFGGRTQSSFFLFLFYFFFNTLHPTCSFLEAGNKSHHHGKPPLKRATEIWPVKTGLIPAMKIGKGPYQGSTFKWCLNHQNTWDCFKSRVRVTVSGGHNPETPHVP